MQPDGNSPGSCSSGTQAKQASSPTPEAVVADLELGEVRRGVLEGLGDRPLQLVVRKPQPVEAVHGPQLRWNGACSGARPSTHIHTKEVSGVEPGMPQSANRSQLRRSMVPRSAGMVPAAAQGG
jgi:hypothetical protein